MSAVILLAAYVAFVTVGVTILAAIQIRRWDDQTRINRNLDRRLRDAETQGRGTVTTEYAECPECLDDGPHQVRADGDLQCSECGEVFPDPFGSEGQ